MAQEKTLDEKILNVLDMRIDDLERKNHDEKVSCENLTRRNEVLAEKISTLEKDHEKTKADIKHFQAWIVSEFGGNGSRGNTRDRVDRLVRELTALKEKIFENGLTEKITIMGVKLEQVFDSQKLSKKLIFGVISTLVIAFILAIAKATFTTG